MRWSGAGHSADVEGVRVQSARQRAVLLALVWCVHTRRSSMPLLLPPRATASPPRTSCFSLRRCTRPLALRLVHWPPRSPVPRSVVTRTLECYCWLLAYGCVHVCHHVGSDVVSVVLPVSDCVWLAIVVDVPLNVVVCGCDPVCPSAGDSVQGVQARGGGCCHHQAAPHDTAHDRDTSRCHPRPVPGRCQAEDGVGVSVNVNVSVRV